jgi:hypothetical protein
MNWIKLKQGNGRSWLDEARKQKGATSEGKNSPADGAFAVHRCQRVIRSKSYATGDGESCAL